MNEILDVSRIASGGSSSRYEPLDLADIVRDAAAQARAEIARSGVDAAARPRAGAGLWDRMRLEQVVTNLLLERVQVRRRASPSRCAVEADGARARVA